MLRTYIHIWSTICTRALMQKHTLCKYVYVSNSVTFQIQVRPQFATLFKYCRRGLIGALHLKISNITHLGNALQGAVQTSIAMMLGVIDTSVGHLRNGRQHNAH